GSDAVRSVAIDTVQGECSRKHTHCVHEFVNRNAFENLDVFEDFFRHLRPRCLTGLAACEHHAEHACDNHSHDAKNHWPRSELHMVSPTFGKVAVYSKENDHKKALDSQKGLPSCVLCNKDVISCFF